MHLDVYWYILEKKIVTVCLHLVLFFLSSIKRNWKKMLHKVFSAKQFSRSSCFAVKSLWFICLIFVKSDFPCSICWVLMQKFQYQIDSNKIDNIIFCLSHLQQIHVLNVDHGTTIFLPVSVPELSGRKKCILYARHRRDVLCDHPSWMTWQ